MRTVRLPTVRLLVVATRCQYWRYPRSHGIPTPVHTHPHLDTPWTYPTTPRHTHPPRTYPPPLSAVDIMSSLFIACYVILKNKSPSLCDKNCVFDFKPFHFYVEIIFVVCKSCFYRKRSLVIMLLSCIILICNASTSTCTKIQHICT